MSMSMSRRRHECWKAFYLQMVENMFFDELPRFMGAFDRR
jgi:hypothetical protein